MSRNMRCWSDTAGPTSMASSLYVTILAELLISQCVNNQSFL